MKKVLAIDGGGIRGIIPALVLAEIEKKTGARTAEIFDLIAGTSTGGILALALGVPGKEGRPRYPASALVDLYAKRGRDIFRRSFWKGMASVAGLADERYPHGPLEKVLAEYLGEHRLGAACTKVLISSYDLEARQPFFFKSWREEAAAVFMWQAARATSAAPTYFEPAPVQVGSETHGLIDGGVFLNNPVVSAFAEARRLYGDERLLVVSLGTGELTRPIPYEEAKDWGLVEWALPLLAIVFDGVSDAADYQVRQILGPDFFRFQVRLDVASDDMDNASQANIEALKSEARKLIRNNKAELERLLALMAAA